MTFACNDLDIPPLNIITDSDIFPSETGVKSYIMRIYADAPISIIPASIYNSPFLTGLYYCTGEAVGTSAPNGESPGGGKSAYWNYTHIRNINNFLQELPKYADRHQKEKTDTWLGEAYFHRAFAYFAMTRSYGGVPIVDKVLNYPEQSIEELMAPRNTESECYKFIIEDLDKAISLLPTSNEKGRVNRYIAYGMKARIALHAASVAKYGTMQLDGLLGIPAGEAQAYFQLAWDAAKATEAGGYALYNDGSGDLAASFVKIFIDTDSKETMFAKYYVYPDYYHDFEQKGIPAGFGSSTGGYTSWINPTLDFVEMFDDIDGNPFILNSGTDANPVLYEKRVDIFAKAEPRLRGSVIFPGDEFKGIEIDVRKGIIPEGGTMEDMLITTSGEAYTGTNIPGTMNIQGNSGIGYAESTKSGFYLRKLLNPNTPMDMILYTTTPFINMRYAEMLLIRAEAGMELKAFGDGSKVDDAVACMQLVRDRAGAKNRYTATDLTLELVRKERRMEFLCENITYWDLKRWRTYDKEFTNKTLQVLWPVFVWDEQKYYMKKSTTSQPISFLPMHYYAAIGAGEIQTNPLLVQNPGY
jgi:hypothetical protein